MSKLTISAYTDFSLDELDNMSLNSVIDNLRAYEDAGWSDLKFEVEYDYDVTYVRLKGKRLETDAEQKARVQLEKKNAEKNKKALEAKKKKLIQEAKKLGLTVTEKH